jgi:hypothetical protein
MDHPQLLSLRSPKGVVPFIIGGFPAESQTEEKTHILRLLAYWARRDTVCGWRARCGAGDFYVQRAHWTCGSVELLRVAVSTEKYYPELPLPMKWWRAADGEWVPGGMIGQ